MEHYWQITTVTTTTRKPLNQDTQTISFVLRHLHSCWPSHALHSHILEHDVTTSRRHDDDVTTTTRRPLNQDNVSSQTGLLCPSFDFIWVWVAICSLGGVWVLRRRCRFRFPYPICKLIGSIQSFISHYRQHLHRVIASYYKIK